MTISPTAGYKTIQQELLPILKKNRVGKDVSNFFSSENFKYTNKHDIGGPIERKFEVLWFDPSNNKTDKKFFDHLMKKHPAEMQKIQKKYKNDQHHKFTDKTGSRLANNNIDTMLSDFKKDKNTTFVFKKIIGFCILREAGRVKKT